LTPDFAGNVATTRHLLEAVCTHAPAARVLLIGSAAEYGWVRPEDNPVREDHRLARVALRLVQVCQTHLRSILPPVRGVDVVLARCSTSRARGPRLACSWARWKNSIARLKPGEGTRNRTGQSRFHPRLCSGGGGGPPAAEIAPPRPGRRGVHVGAALPVRCAT